MRGKAGVLVSMAGAALLGGCHAPPGDEAPITHGRFAGIGVYSAGELWSKMVVSPPSDASSATIADDEHVIVVVDSQSGEVRECGDYSGVCASFNPWTKAIAGPQIAPMKLTKHAADLAAEARSATSKSR